MANPYFTFKKFIIYHDLCAMKVGTDGVTLGAWAGVTNAESILDIGTGTGLISLMLAQRNLNSIVDAIDIDDSAIKQAYLNFSSSPWKNRFNIFHSSLQNFVLIASRKYDLIVSNPPYFRDSLKTPEVKRAKARHTDTLSHHQLIDHSITLLAPKGNLCLILPVKEGNECIEYAESKNLYCIEKVFLFPNPHSLAKRLLIKFSLEDKECTISKLTIETAERHQYTPEYIELVKDFYLKL